MLRWARTGIQKLTSLQTASVVAPQPCAGNPQSLSRFWTEILMEEKLKMRRKTLLLCLRFGHRVRMRKDENAANN
jgi:hypothetical protein